MITPRIALGTPGFSDQCSTNWAIWSKIKNYLINYDEGNRNWTHIIGFEDQNFTIKLFPLFFGNNWNRTSDKTVMSDPFYQLNYITILYMKEKKKMEVMRFELITYTCKA